jgi:hypothetical protein
LHLLNFIAIRPPPSAFGTFPRKRGKDIQPAAFPPPFRCAADDCGPPHFALPSPAHQSTPAMPHFAVPSPAQRGEGHPTYSISPTIPLRGGALRPAAFCAPFPCAAGEGAEGGWGRTGYPAWQSLAMGVNQPVGVARVIGVQTGVAHFNSDVVPYFRDLRGESFALAVGT